MSKYTGITNVLEAYDGQDTTTIEKATCFHVHAVTDYYDLTADGTKFVADTREFSDYQSALKYCECHADQFGTPHVLWNDHQ